MSSKVKKIRENVEADKKLKLYTLYGTLVGSVIVTLGKLVNKTEDEMLKDFAYYSKDEDLFKCKNIKEVCEYIKRDYGVPEEYEDNIVLIYDEKNVYTPVVTIMDEDGVVYPLDRDGNAIGVLAHLGSEDVKVEYIYES